ncbi:hypothetical protein LTR10_024178 [Elasticomyces elasticus]|uniref:PLD phosphodiesterase domain-containing protein n=1 Tax=Exophiala sideris TaxID=1016849 RepID=A0ABR0J7F9_9EURO|nr:hypothetical protein LTR10_024178 [Elasticomyces elasticus]KAK5029290.1 hypothetical protein LTS07_005752 [Exophiala sideris]KAK5037016.1 hypothetical protein LTR13_005396 [Exophiala sideris]KAK5057920.1 hypothetical protein LTR69_006917 [Exophiala sideris]KAK5181879.1 hypothetical protein LTR44_005480 [Eurotiomycetes sp. CCFEE 6388]
MAPTLRELNDFLSALDPQNFLDGISFHLDANNQLGFRPSDPFDFYVATPYGNWNNYPTPGPPEPNVVASAISKALDIGLQSPNVSTSSNGQKYIFIDFLNYSRWDVSFWTNDGDNGILGTLRFFVNRLPSDVTPVIRLLSAEQGINIGWWNDDKNLDGWNFFQQNFWVKGASAFTHPKAQLYLGWYNPDFKKASQFLGGAEGALDLPGWVDVLIQRLEAYVKKESPEALFKVLEKFFPAVKINAQKAYDYVQANGLPAVSWNHAKMVVVNGTTLTTGGVNYWDEYGDGSSGIFDAIMKVQGDASLAGHKFADGFWSYLNAIPGRDDQSMSWTIKLATPAPTGAGNFTQSTNTPLFINTTQSARNTGPVTTLTVAKAGDKLPSYRYPLLTLDLIRDGLYSALWLYLQQNYPDYLHIWPVLVSALADTELQPVMAQYNTSPVVWASKSARLHAISSATSHIYVCQQVLVTWFLKDNPQADVLQAYLLQHHIKWDKMIWPWDLLVALCQGLSTIVDHYADDVDKSVYILLTGTDGVAIDGYGDLMKFADLIANLKVMLLALNTHKMLPKPLKQTDDAYVDKLLADRVQCKRIMGNDLDAHHQKVGAHNKVVCVDRALLYVGSDNAYPQYNEQHGIWIEEQTNIDAWFSGYFDEAWKRAVRPAQ